MSSQELFIPATNEDIRRLADLAIKVFKETRIEAEVKFYLQIEVASLEDVKRYIDLDKMAQPVLGWADPIGQIMKYYEYPANGVGSYSYTHDDYGNQSANFESTTYDWQSMSNNVGTNASALLLYHIGVSVDMDYGPSGSGASSVNAPYILANYFILSNSP